MTKSTVRVDVPPLLPEPVRVFVDPSTQPPAKRHAFAVDGVEPAATLLEEIPYQEYVLHVGFQIYTNKTETNPNRLLVHSQQDENVVKLKGSNPQSFNQFMLAMDLAYQEHRPFVIAPDHIWLLICQGFAMHVGNNPDAYRQIFKLDNQTTQIEVNQQDSRGRLKSWPEIMEEVAAQTGEKVSQDLYDWVMADFSTSGPTEKLAKAVVFSDLLSDFTNVIVYGACGFPEIVIEGTPEDWNNIRERTRRLRNFGLEEWVEALDPVLGEFVLAAEGRENKAFWQSMYKTNKEGFYKSTMFNGWIKNFFPYVTIEAEQPAIRNTFAADQYVYLGELHKGFGAVDFTYVIDGTEIPMQFRAGFSGIVQDPVSKALRARIQWMLYDTRDPFYWIEESSSVTRDAP